MLLALKRGEGATSQGLQVLLESGGGKEMDSSLEPPEGPQPCHYPHLQKRSCVVLRAHACRNSLQRPRETHGDGKEVAVTVATTKELSERARQRS